MPDGNTIGDIPKDDDLWEGVPGGGRTESCACWLSPTSLRGPPAEPLLWWSDRSGDRTVGSCQRHPRTAQHDDLTGRPGARGIGGPRRPPCLPIIRFHLSQVATMLCWMPLDATRRRQRCRAQGVLSAPNRRSPAASEGRCSLTRQGVAMFFAERSVQQFAASEPAGGGVVLQQAPSWFASQEQYEAFLKTFLMDAGAQCITATSVAVEQLDDGEPQAIPRPVWAAADIAVPVFGPTRAWTLQHCWARRAVFEKTLV